MHPYSNRTWSNYTNCVDWNDLNFRLIIINWLMNIKISVLLTRMTLNSISLLGLSLSILLLLISCIIFSCSPSLRSGRVTMHNNLCLSLLGSSLAWLTWHFSVLDRHHIWAANSLWCRSVVKSDQPFLRILKGKLTWVQKRGADQMNTSLKNFLAHHAGIVGTEL